MKTDLYMHVVSGDVQTWEEWEVDAEKSIKDTFYLNENGTYSHPESGEDKSLEEWVKGDLDGCLELVDDNKGD